MTPHIRAAATRCPRSDDNPCALLIQITDETIRPVAMRVGRQALGTSTVNMITHMVNFRPRGPGIRPGFSGCLVDAERY